MANGYNLRAKNLPIRDIEAIQLRTQTEVQTPVIYVMETISSIGNFLSEFVVP